MTAAVSKGYVLKRQSNAPIVPCPCGSSTRILTTADGAPCSLHVTSITDSVRHYHRETTEVFGSTFAESAENKADSPITG
jgi:hypothetical protein